MHYTTMKSLLFVTLLLLVAVLVQANLLHTTTPSTAQDTTENIMISSVDDWNFYMNVNSTGCNSTNAHVDTATVTVTTELLINETSCPWRITLEGDLRRDPSHLEVAEFASVDSDCSGINEHGEFSGRCSPVSVRIPVLHWVGCQEDQDLYRIPEDFVADISSVVFKAKQSEVGDNVKSNAPSLPKVKSLRWRIDVAISTSVLNRALEPAILMEMVLSNGTVHNFEVPVSKFHELRYNVAFIMKEMENLEKRNILKVQD